MTSKVKTNAINPAFVLGALLVVGVWFLVAIVPRWVFRNDDEPVADDHLARTAIMVVTPGCAGSRRRVGELEKSEGLADSVLPVLADDKNPEFTRRVCSLQVRHVGWWVRKLVPEGEICRSVNRQGATIVAEAEGKIAAFPAFVIDGQVVSPFDAESRLGELGIQFPRPQREGKHASLGPHTESGGSAD